MSSSSTVQSMALRGRSRAGPNTGTGLPEGDDPETPAEAAEQFEKVLVRQFVEVMTKGMFSNSLAGEKGGGWMKSQRDRQRNMMTDMMTDHLVEAGNLGVSEKLTKRWGVSNSSGESDTSSSGDASSLRESVDPLPIAPPDTSPRSDAASSTREGQHVDHAA